MKTLQTNLPVRTATLTLGTLAIGTSPVAVAADKPVFAPGEVVKLRRELDIKN